MGNSVVTPDKNRNGDATRAISRADSDLIALGIAIAAILLFVGTGGIVMPQIARSWLFGAQAPNQVLVTALLLNIALIVFGWRRYRELHDEVEQRRIAEAQARELAETDPLTGCLNRRSASPAALAMLATCRDERRQMAALMLDLDKFKAINDLNGHSVGDQVLVEVTRRIRAQLPDDALLARLGGDEFLVLARFDRNRATTMDALAGRIIAAVSRPFVLPGLELETTTSIGIARDDETGDAADDAAVIDGLLHRSDIAMYHAKKHGRNRHAWFEGSMATELRRRSEIEKGVRNGIRNGEFVPYYEQQIDLATGRLTGFEMLARWHSPEMGVVRPDIFIPIAEELGLIGALSENLISQALDDAREWADHLTLSVNISPLQLRDPWFSQKLLRMLVESGFPPARLEIEITESCLHENVGVVRAVIASLKNQGVQVSLDDFGTGYASLAQLRSLPFDRIKIDRSFIKDLGADASNTHIVDAIVALGRGLDLPITAEGIENADILHHLRGLGQLKGQGYLYGQPTDAEATREWLRQQKLVGAPQDTRPLTSEQAAELGSEQRTSLAG